MRSGPRSLRRDPEVEPTSDTEVRPPKIPAPSRFEVAETFLDRYEVQLAGGRSILEHWIPAEDLEELNRNIIGQIEVVAEYR